MGRYLSIFVMILVLAFLEATILPFNLTLLVIFSLAVFGNEKPVFLIAFFSGVFLDILKGGYSGVSSLAFLFSSAIIVIYKNRFKLDEVRFFLPFCFFIILVINYYYSQNFDLLKTFFETFLLIIITPLVKIFIGKKFIGL